MAAEQQCGVSCGAQGDDGMCVCRVYVGWWQSEHKQTKQEMKGEVAQ